MIILGTKEPGRERIYKRKGIKRSHELKQKYGGFFL
jgi:hypothetical protein